VADSATYPQAPPLTEDELTEFLQSAKIARLATHDADGSIHLAPMYFVYEVPDILLGTQRISRKVRNIARDPRVSVLVDVLDTVPIGAVIYGTAELDDRDVVAKRATIFRRYMPDGDADAFAHQLADTWEPVVIRVRPERIISFDYRKGFPASG
jgi:PPOX class probable F420-dependent enzyme